MIGRPVSGRHERKHDVRRAGECHLRATEDGGRISEARAVGSGRPPYNLTSSI
jgi:hypothetical protein